MYKIKYHFILLTAIALSLGWVYQPQDTSVLFKNKNITIDLSIFEKTKNVILSNYQYSDKVPSIKKRVVLAKKKNVKRSIEFQTINKDLYLPSNEEKLFDNGMVESIDQFQPEQLALSDEVEEFEVDDSELIEHYGFNVNPVEVASWSQNFKGIDFEKIAFVAKALTEEEAKPKEQIKEERSNLLAEASIGSFNNSKEVVFEDDDKLILEDIVKMVQASKKEISKNSNNEMVFLDLKAPPGGIKDDKKVNNSRRNITAISQLGSLESLSPNVQKVINRELKKETVRLSNRLAFNTTVASHRQNSKKMLHGLGLDTQKSFGYSSQIKDAFNFYSTKKNSNFDLLAVSAHLGKKIGDDIYEFDFIPEFDKNQRLLSDKEGVLNFSSDLNNGSGSLRGTILKSGMLRTKVDIVLSKRSGKMIVPLLSSLDFQKFLEENNLKGFGGHLLLEVGEEVSFVEVDRSYEAKIFLDDDLKIVENDKFRYVLFVGVNPGNALLSFIWGSNEKAEKIVQVSEEEVLFNQITVRKGRKEAIALFERNLLAREAQDLNISGMEVVFFNSDYRGKKKGLNVYEYFKPALPAGSRQYLELKHLNQSIFLGHWRSQKAELPSQDFINLVLENFYYQELSGKCLVQINLQKSVSEMMIEGDTGSDVLNFSALSLDKNGQFSDSVDQQSEKIFISGEGQGIFNIKIDYTDKTTDYLQAICSEDTYIVEQL